MTPISEKATRRLLVAAQDPGSVGHLSAIAEKASGLLDLHLVAASPAYEMFSRMGLSVRRVPALTTRSSSDEKAAQLRALSASILADVRPDAVLVGSSGPEAGLCEALMATTTVPYAYAFQDFWGDVNKVFGTPAGTYFVVDAEAERLTREIHGVNARVVGSPKHSRFGCLDIGMLRHETRAALGADNGRPVFGYFGQPLWKSQGYEKTVTSLAGTIAATFPDAIMLYRPHPKESDEEIGRVRRKLQEALPEAVVLTSGSVEGCLAACDVICTAFSSCGYDHMFLAKYSASPLGVVVYLRHDPEIRRLYHDYTGFDFLPVARDGLALVTEVPEEVPAVLRSALDPGRRLAIWDRIARVLPDPSLAAQRVVDSICADLAVATGITEL